ncbi:hypothetical protein VMCG_07367 [Cytospora schulzeri]|uniref:Uncharacterized protein n=1 Tax=Cytospora schulzeri TaxID=448051 RepID=A0A423W306_9PEZI|nr:hypothetical protein VMCG_07367 [Valsa malicola]
MATPDSTPIDPDDLARRLQNVLAEQHLQELQLSKRLQGQDIDLFKLGRKLNLRQWKNAASTKEAQSQLGSVHQGHTPSKGEQRKPVRKAFRTKSTYSARSDSDCASTSGCTPKNDYKNVEHAASSRHSHGQREITQKHDPHETDRRTSVMELESVDENGRGRAGESEKKYPRDWTQSDTSDSKPRGLQLLRRMGSMSALKAKLGSDTREYHDERGASRTQIGSIPEEGPAVQRKSSIFLKLRR